MIKSAVLTPSYGSGGGLRKRYFLVSWYKQFPWIHFYKSRMKVFCYYCKLSHDSNVGLVSSKADPAFITTGFCNWKKGMEKFKDHESSLAHKNSLAAIIASRNVSVSNLIQQRLHKEQVQ